MPAQHSSLNYPQTHDETLLPLWLAPLSSLVCLSSPDPTQKPESVANPFLQQVYSLLEDRLDDSSFGVDELATGLAMSRRTLYRKLAVLLNLSASDLIQQYRLKRAAELLLAGDSISQTAYQVGFESPQYFAKVFKEFYKYTPTQFSHR